MLDWLSGSKRRRTGRARPAPMRRREQRGPSLASAVASLPRIARRTAGRLGSRHAERPQAKPDERERGSGIAGHLATHRELDAGPRGGIDRLPDETKDGRMEGIAVSLERRIAAIDRQGVLRQIVRPEAGEGDPAEVRVARRGSPRGSRA